MRRKVLIGLVLALVLLGMMSMVSFAQGGVLREYTAYQVMNLGTETAHVRVDYYNGAGQQVFNRTFDIAPGGSRNIQQKTDDTALLEGVYSAVISSDQPIAAIVGQMESDPAVNTGQYTSPFSDYTGMSAGSRTVTLPVLEYNWFGQDSMIRLMNAGDGPADVTIQFYAGRLNSSPTGAANIAPLSRSIPQYAAITLDQAGMSELAATSGPWMGRFLGSAVISSNQPLVAVVNETNATDRIKYTYNGFGSDDAGTELLAPAIFSRFFSNTFTSLTVANPSTTQSVSVTITYTGGALSVRTGGGSGAGHSISRTFSLGPGEASVRYEGSGDLGDLWADFQRFGGSARISASGPVVAKVNQSQTAATGNNQKPSGSYNAVAISRLTTRVAVPLIQADFYGFYTSMTCANGSTTQTANISITYRSDNLSARPDVSGSFSHQIPPGGSIIRYEAVRNGDLADINRTNSPWDTGTTVRFNGSAIVSSTNGVPIACVVNEQANAIPFDNMYTYNAVNVSPTP